MIIHDLRKLTIYSDEYKDTENQFNNYSSRFRSITGSSESRRYRHVVHETNMYGVISTINGGSNIVNNRINPSEMNYGTMYNIYVYVGY